MKMVTISAMTLEREASKDQSLYEMARAMFSEGFAIVAIDATMVPEELLGEVVELNDYWFPAGSNEPVFEIQDGIEVPMSSLVRI